MKNHPALLYHKRMENYYTQTPDGEEIDKIILDWYANMSEPEMEYWTLYAAHVVSAAKQKGAKTFGLQTALILVARYELGLVPSNVIQAMIFLEAARERVAK